MDVIKKTLEQARIFVSIASYRDQECPWTLRDLFLKARHPERVFAGVLWQMAPEDPESWRDIPQRHHQVRGLVVEAASSLGVCWARHRIQNELQQDEMYYLQIDSHSRFAPDWDVRFITMLARCPSPKPVLTAHPLGYKPPDNVEMTSAAPILWASRFNDEGVLMPKGKVFPHRRDTVPTPTAFVGGGCLFTKAAAVRQVPYDPYLYFHGEEISLSVRFWTHGFDLFNPHESLVYHDYTNRGRPRHWDDHLDWPTMNRRAAARLQHLLGMAKVNDQDALRDFDHYGLGHVRTLEEYETFADIDFRHRRIGPRATDGLFPPPAMEDPDGLAMRRCFTDIFLKNQWKSSQTRSGSGSEPRVTKALRLQLREMIAAIRVRVLVDAGCGDLAWLDDITPELDLYLGFDLVEELVTRNRVLYGHRKNHFFNTADISTHLLPPSDAILCRNTFSHLPNDRVAQALRLFQQSKSRLLIATTFPSADNVDIVAGKWRKMDLTAPPFSLPSPQSMIPDGEVQNGCFLGVWKLADG